MYYWKGSKLMTKPLITGATGFIGSHLCRLVQPYNVLTRRPENAPPELAQAACFRWAPEAGPPAAEAFAGCNAVFHLAGEPVAEGRWTREKKARIRDSRTLGTRHLVAALKALESPPTVLVSASAVGYYGTRGDEVLGEHSSPGTGFLADVCREWEAAARRAEKFGVRVVTIRIGLVLGKQGGALATMLPLFKLGAGGPLGNGQQWMPWIEVEDLVRLFVFAAENEFIRGPVNGTAPNPVRNLDFTRKLGRAVKRPAILPAPAFGLRFALGEFADVLLASQRAVPQAAEDAGFEFRHKTLDAALAHIL